MRKLANHPEAAAITAVRLCFRRSNVSSMSQSFSRTLVDTCGKFGSVFFSGGEIGRQILVQQDSR